MFAVARADVNGGHYGGGFEPPGGTKVSSGSVCDLETTLVTEAASYSSSQPSDRSTAFFHFA